MSERVSEVSNKEEDNENDKFSKLFQLLSLTVLDISDTSFKLNTNTEKNIFYLFTVFFVFIVFSQLDVSNSFNVNEAVRQAIDENDLTFRESQTLGEYYQAYENTVKFIYGTLSNYNYVISTVRLTQRRIQMQNNTSGVSKNFIPLVWAGSGIDYNDGQQSFESTNYYGPTAPGTASEVSQAFTYVAETPGYTISIDTSSTTFAEMEPILQEIEAQGWYDEQTANLLLDFVVYNPYLQILTYTKVECKVNPSGRLSIEVDTESIQRSYYSTAFDIFRCVLEFIFLIICMVYISRKIYEIYQEYLEIQNQFQKDEKRKRFKKEEAKRAEELEKEE